MLAGIDPDTTPLGDFLDASWAVWCEFVGPEQFAAQWSEVTGVDPMQPAPDTAATTGTAPPPSLASPADRSGGDQESVAVLRDLSDDDLARWVPAFRRALDNDDEQALDTLDRHWAYTASFAAGQESLKAFAGDASRSVRTTDDGTTVVTKPATAPSGPAFGMPVDGGDI